ncbi:MAG: hypothetical protein CM15mP59_2810 [Flavobacteriaceae bacterium]|nr:MAG: hypothetical protein CM15mP59_2810 [Flavobacteriaceae bacterium]
MDAELLEFVVSQDSKVLGKKIKDLDISRTATIGGVIREGRGLSPLEILKLCLATEFCMLFAKVHFTH